MYGGEERYIQGFGGGNLREKDHLEGLGIDGNMILIWILEELGWDGVNCFNLTQEVDNWQTFVNMVMKLKFP